MISQEIKQGLFDICSQNNPPYAYIIAYVKIEENDTRNEFHITDVEWAETRLGWIDSDDVRNDLLELIPVDIEVPGYYLLKGLFPVEYDSDDYRSWAYTTEPEIVEYELQMALEQGEKYKKEWEDLGDVTDLFN